MNWTIKRLLLENSKKIWKKICSKTVFWGLKRQNSSVTSNYGRQFDQKGKKKKIGVFEKVPTVMYGHLYYIAMRNTK